jgi:hypothetical protein
MTLPTPIEGLEIRRARPSDEAQVVALLAAEKLSIPGLSEHFGDFLVAERNGNIVGAMGLELRGALDTGGVALRPFAAAGLEKDLIGDGRTVRFAQTSAPVIVNSWELEDRSKKAYARLTGGAAATILQGVNLDALVSGTIGRDDGDEVSAHVGLSFGF